MLVAADFSKVVHHSFPVMLAFGELMSAKSDSCATVRADDGKWDLVLRLFRGDGLCVQLTIAINPNGEPETGGVFKNQRWGLLQLGPTVWAVAPSVNAGGYHGYVVVRGVPEPAPWEICDHRPADREGGAK